MIQRSAAVGTGDPETGANTIYCYVILVFCINTDEFPCAFSQITRWPGRHRDERRMVRDNRKNIENVFVR